jgi:D-ribose pyranase
MKKSAVLNDQLSLLISQLGHTDTMAIADCGLPIPEATKRIDLSVTFGIPSFLSVLRTVLSDLSVEQAILAEEMKTVSPGLWEETKKALGTTPIQYVSHEELKKMLPSCKGVVRTGECTSFANIILVSTVKFS